jgi:hypothetical protein
MKIIGSLVLEEVADQLNIDLPKLVAGCAFWSPVNAAPTKAVHPHIRRARSGEEPRTVTPEAIRLDDNTYANKVLKDKVSHLGKFAGFAVCHIWPQTCYDERYHTMPANLVLLPRELAGLTDHHREVEQCLQFRAWELYGWYPDGQAQPVMPANYPDNWRVPVPKPISTKQSNTKTFFPNQNGRGRDVLPIILNPSDPDEFRHAFIAKGRAMMSIYFADGRVETEEWLCQRFGPTSNVIGNLRSKSKFRSGEWQRLGITKVIVTIPCEGGVAK